MKILTNPRYYVLAVLAVIAAALILCAPREGLPTAHFFTLLLIPKLLGAGAVYLIYRLVDYWGGEGQIPELTDYINDLKV